MTQMQTISQVVFANPSSLNVVAFRQDQLVDMLLKNKGATAVTIVARTMPKGAKPPVFKVSRVNGMIGWNYANSVNNQLAREGKATVFVARPRAWGTRIEGTPLVEHKGEYYLEFKVEKSLDYRFEDENGNEINEKTVSLLPSRKPQTQGTEKEIILRDYKVSSIVSITYKGVCYLIAR